MSGPDHTALGFACLWDPEPRRTWSGTPYALREALQAQDEVADVALVIHAFPRPGTLTGGAGPLATEGERR